MSKSRKQQAGPSKSTANQRNNGSGGGDEWRGCLKANGVIPIKLIGDGTYSKVYTCDVRNAAPFLQRPTTAADDPNVAGPSSASHPNHQSYYNPKRKNIQAVKVIDERKASQTFRNNFLPRELDLISRLDHPNVVGDFRWFKYSSFTFILSEYEPNGDLEQYITKNGALRDTNPMDLAHVMFRQMCGGVRYLHSRMIAHRDLKCENVFLDRFRNAKIGDFGFSRRMRNAEESSKTWCGSKAYAAPEVIRQVEYNPFLSDIWSLGIILYVMMEAVFPFDDRNSNKLLRAIEHPRQVLRFRRIRRQAAVKDLLFMMLNPTPMSRASFADLASANWLRHTSYVMYEDAETEPPDQLLSQASQASVQQISSVEEDQSSSWQSSGVEVTLTSEDDTSTPSQH